MNSLRGLQMYQVDKIERPDVLFVQAFHEALRACGVTDSQRDAALRAADASHAKFWMEDLGSLASQAFARALVERVADPSLGLKLGAAMKNGATGVVEYAVLTAPTLRATHAIYTRLGPLIAEYLTYTIVDEGSYTATEFRSPSGLVVERLFEDYRLVRMVHSARRSLGQAAFSPAAVRFTYARPAALKPHEAAFGKGVRFEFGCLHAGVVLPTAVLDQPLPTSEPVLHRILLEYGEQLLSQAAPSTNLAARVRQTLLATLHDGRPSIALVAKRMSLSERTLRRRLAEENTSFGELLDEVRAQLARVLGRAPACSGKDIASKLGFESTSALRRAQKRWLAEAQRPAQE